MIRYEESARAISQTMPIHSYSLENLYRDQEHDWVVDLIPAVLAWVSGGTGQLIGPPFSFKIEQTVIGQPSQNQIIHLDWNIAALELEDSDVIARFTRMATRRTPLLEQVPQLAAYGLALVAISVLMPGRRIVDMNFFVAPDLLFDLTPGALRGVEVAGRTQGGLRALREVRDGRIATAKSPARPGKKQALIARVDLAECHLSLWCASPRVAIQEQVK